MRSIIVVGGVCALALASTTMLATSAEAGARGTCAKGWACLYENNDFNNGNTDHWRDFRSSNYDFNKVLWRDSHGSQTNDHMDNETSAIRNRRGCTVRLWQNVGGTGASTDFHNNVSDGFLKNNSIGDNRASAIQMCV
ncbi:MAG TPA: hypothetical protein VFX70_04465 [Mycobacteriales bacterium]|nr:hypothetical protein [Mycobacteriales bacterium]